MVVATAIFKRVLAPSRGSDDTLKAVDMASEQAFVGTDDYAP